MMIFYFFFYWGRLDYFSSPFLSSLVSLALQMFLNIDLGVFG